jgi:hypothetical protein
VATFPNSSGKLDKLLKEIKSKAENTQLNIGILEGATNSEGESVAAYAADNEFGGSAPPRPFMRMTADKHGKEWTNQVGHLIQNQNWDFEAALQVVGDIASKDMMEMIQTFPKAPPNSDATIARKKALGYTPSDQPLIESGDMIRAVSFEVE